MTKASSLPFLQRFRWVLLALVLGGLGLGWEMGLDAVVTDRLDNRILKESLLAARWGGLVRVQKLTREPFEVFCLLTPAQTAVGEESGLYEAALNAEIQKMFPKGLPDGTFGFAYADQTHVHIDTYPETIGLYRLLDRGSVHKNTMASFMDDVHPANCAKRGEAAFFTFPSRGVILVRDE